MLPTCFNTRASFCITELGMQATCKWTPENKAASKTKQYEQYSIPYSHCLLQAVIVREAPWPTLYRPRNLASDIRWHGGQV
jgi:hypothetical protein